MSVTKVEVDRYECGRCNHKWFPKNPGKPDNKLPQACTKCHSAYWNESRVYKISSKGKPAEKK